MNLSNFLIWFYCLDYHELYLLTVLGTLFYTLCLPRFFTARKFRQLSVVLVVCCLVVIVGTTLFTRSLVTREPSFIPFHSYFEAVHTGNVEIYRSNLMNTLLFYPFGLFLASAFQEDRKKLLLGLVFAAVLSTEIELCQFWFHLGNPEIDDVLHNTLGMLLGLAVPCFMKKICSGRAFNGSDR